MVLQAVRPAHDTPDRKRDFLELGDHSFETLSVMLDAARDAKRKPQSVARSMTGKSLALIWDKRSVRTRDSFYVGFTKLGGLPPVDHDFKDLKIGEKESLEHVAGTLSQYFSGIVIRVSNPEIVRGLAAHAAVPVINAMTDDSHPCQAMADVLTMQEKFGPDLQGLKMVFAGDYINNVARTHMEAARIFGYKLVVSGPESLQAQFKLPAHVEFNGDLRDAVKGAQVVQTDVWTSMGQEGKAEDDFRPYQVTGDIMAKADAFMHCMPVSPGYERGAPKEVTADVLASPKSVILQQAQNRMWAQNGMMIHCLR